MRPLNSNLVCKGKESNETSISGFSVKSLDRFRELEVIASSEDDIKVGDKVKVSVSAGEQDGEYIIIRRSDVIYII